jgi:hypothetical protein
MMTLFSVLHFACHECMDCEFSFQTSRQDVDVIQMEEPEYLQEYIQLPSTCDGDTTSDDPITLTNNYFVQNDLFAEMLDVKIDEDNQEVFAVGQGGVMRFSLSPEYTLIDFTDDEGGRYDNLVLGPDRVLYATHPDHGLFLFQYENELLLRGRINKNGLKDLSIKDDVLYVVSLEGVLHVYDISEPLEPYVISTVSGLDTPWRSDIQDDYLFVADKELGLVSFDISDPENTLILENNTDGGTLTDVVVNQEHPTYVYGAAGGEGLVTYLVENGDIIHLENIQYSQPLLSVDQKGDMLWASSHQDILLFDIAIPEFPQLINAQKTEQWAMALAARDESVIVADWAYLTEFLGNTSITAPDIDVSTHSLTSFPKEGGYRNFRIHNFGQDTLELKGATSELEVWFEQQEIEPQASIQVTVFYKGGGAIKDSLCISSNDPDEADFTIDVGTRSDNAMMGKSAPNFTLEGLDGNTYTLSDYQGSPVVLIYFATW